eukprot:TRINITY_DN11373_c0_g2_i2.p1 TRINITY_DN11373_c0_g2~~TRINITY_DN11373_c0_g2_i2.p1  ORF type:complete len:514 (-),score=58.23 TRINITY_DN11373_c0_g2_i2:21-1562(-)
MIGIQSPKGGLVSEMNPRRRLLFLCFVLLSAVLMLYALDVGVITITIKPGTTGSDFLLPLDPPTRPQTSYMIELDAGSSHTGAFLFKWDNSLVPGGLQLVHSESDHSSGLATQTPDQAAASVVTLVNSLVAGAPAQVTALMDSIQIRLRGTAGLRTLAADHPTEASALIHAVKEGLLKIWPLSSAQLVDIEDEAVLAWTTATFSAGALAHHSHEEQAARLRGGVDSDHVGTVELGGSSVQLCWAETVAAVHGAPMGNTRATTLHLGPMRRPLRVWVLEGFGVNAMFQSITRALVAQPKPDGTASVLHPCLSKGYTRKFHGEKLEGTGDFQMCLSAVKGRIHELCAQQAPGSPPCGHSLMVSSDHSKQERWFALSGFGHLAEFLTALGIGDAAVTGPVRKHGNAGAGGAWSAEHLGKASQQLCNLDWLELQARGIAVGRRSEKILSGQCFLGVLSTALFVHVFGFGAHGTRQPPMITLTRHLRNLPLDWVAGACLLYTSPSPRDRTRSRMPSSA